MALCCWRRIRAVTAAVERERGAGYLQTACLRPCIPHPHPHLHANHPPLAQNLGSDIADVANLDHLRLAKYFVSPREWADFVSGALKPALKPTEVPAWAAATC